MHQLALEHHDDAVGQLEKLVQVLAGPRHGRAGVAHGDDAAGNRRRRGEVATEHRVGGAVGPWRYYRFLHARPSE